VAGAGQITVSVVLPTRNRKERLEAALASLRGQTLPVDRFEVIVVDDGSTDGTPAVLAAEQARGELRLRTVRRDAPGGPAVAREDAWRSADAPLIAFMDDDCIADPGWLQAGVAAWGEAPDRFVQGPTTPISDELWKMGPFSYTVDIRAMSPEFPTCNIFYPRALLDRVDGFDVEAFPVNGEDTDLAWRAKRAGGHPTFAPDAMVHHAVVRLGPLGFLRRNWSWNHAILVYVRHPELRRQRLFYRRFWNWSHVLVLRLWLALALPRSRFLWPLKWWLARPYVFYRLPHPRHGRRSPPCLAWFTLVDTFEVLAMLRGSIRHRTLVL